MDKRLSLSRDKINILLLEGIHERAAQAFERAGYHQVHRQSGSLSGTALAEALDGVHLLGIRSRSQLSEEVLEQASRLIAVGCFCIGTDQVDLDAAQCRGIPVFNAPFSNTRSVAELIVGEIIMLLRGIPQKDRAAHSGRWLKSASQSHEIRGKCLGIIGYGHIGSQLGVLAESLGMRVIYYDVANKLPLGTAQPADSMESLLSQAQVVSLHVPDTPATRNMIGAAELAAMSPGSVLLNASRGSVVDIDALAQSLTSGHLAGAAVDVFPVEPKTAEDAFKSPLQGLNNVILTPHIGGSTLEAQENIGLEVADKLIRYSDNGSTLSAVNFPEVAMPDLAGRSRIMHIHRNEPGVLRRINEVVSQHEVNIAAQYLQTRDKVGYVVMDIETDHPDTLLDELGQVEATIRTRVLY